MNEEMKCGALTTEGYGGYCDYCYLSGNECDKLEEFLWRRLK